MALDRSKVMAGPFNLYLYDDATEPSVIHSVEGLKKDSASFSTETKVVTEELEDSSEMVEVTGRKVSLEVTYSELDQAVFDAIEGNVGAVEVEFPARSKKIVIDAPDICYASVDGFKTKITVTKGIAFGVDDVDAGFTISAIS